MHIVPRDTGAEPHPGVDAGALAFCADLAQSLAHAIGDAEIMVYLWRDDAAVLAPVARALARASARGVESGRAMRRGAASPAFTAASEPVQPAADLRARIAVPIRRERALLGLIVADLGSPRAPDAASGTSLRFAAELVAIRLAAVAGDPDGRVCGDAANEPMRAPDSARDDFERAVRNALRQLHDVARLRRCALARSARVVAASAAGDDPGLACRRFLLDSLDAIAAIPDLADQARLLRRRFVERAPSQALLAEALHVGGSTLRRHVQRAIALVAGVLWREEQSARLADQTIAGVDGGPRAARPARFPQSIHASPASSAERADSSLRKASPQAR